MRFSKWLGVVILLGCQEKAPTGQVVATLPNSEITAKELNYETRLSGVANEQLALEALIDRKVLVQAAFEREGLECSSARDACGIPRRNDDCRARRSLI